MSKVTIPQAIEVITEAMLEDKSEGSYYYSWQANIAMAFKDEYDRIKERHRIMSSIHEPFSPNIHDIANDAAKHFLDSLCAKPQIEMTNESMAEPVITTYNTAYNQAIQDAMAIIQKYNTGKELSPLMNQLIPKIAALKKPS